MKYFLDTEFIEYPCTIDLISIALVCEDGAEYYAIGEFDESKANEWVKENVIARLDDEPGRYWKTRQQIRDDIISFVGHTKPEFWGYYADYDWVAFCWIFGAMIDLPKGWPMYCRDIKQWCDDLGNPKLPETGKNEHHALADARWNKQAYEFLVEYSNAQ